MKKQGIYKKILHVIWGSILFVSTAVASELILTADAMQWALDSGHCLCEHSVHLQQDSVHLYCDRLEAWVDVTKGPYTGNLMRIEASDALRLSMQEHTATAQTLCYDAQAQTLCLQGRVELRYAQLYSATSQSLHIDLKQRIVRLTGCPELTLPRLQLPALTP